MIKLENLTKTFTQKSGAAFNAVDNVSLEVPAGEMCVLLGPSGCGKTTTLKMINRLIPASGGRIYINGEDTSGQDTVTLRRNIGYVIQQIGLFPNMTIEENITVVPRMLGWDKKRCRERATELMSMVALDPTKFLHRYPREMSGGQQQRIGVIRALAADPPVLLMDEPFGAVDPINREVIQNEFLVQAGDVTDQQPTITVRRSTPLTEAFATMDDNDMRSVTVVDEDGRPLGFVKRREARGAAGQCGELLHHFRVTGKAEENLRVVLSKLYEHNTVWMPIVDEDGRYSGEISQDYIADYLSSGRTRRRLHP